VSWATGPPPAKSGPDDVVIDNIEGSRQVEEAKT